MATTLTDYLARFKTVEEICRTISSYGIKGYRASVEECPLTKLIKSQYPGLEWLGPDQMCFKGIVLKTPDLFTKWIQKFDAGMFPGLVLPGGWEGPPKDPKKDFVQPRNFSLNTKIRRSIRG